MHTDIRSEGMDIDIQLYPIIPSQQGQAAESPLDLPSSVINSPRHAQNPQDLQSLEGPQNPQRDQSFKSSYNHDPLHNLETSPPILQSGTGVTSASAVSLSKSGGGKEPDEQAAETVDEAARAVVSTGRGILA
jgi:hypothetical protein